MKGNRVKIFILAFIVPVLLITCSKEEKLLNISSIELESENTTVLLGETVVIKAVNQDGVDITNEVDIYVDNAKIEGPDFVASEVGEIYVRAKYNKVSSPFLKITVLENITSLTLSVDHETIKPTNYDVATFTVVNQDGDDVTAAVTFFKGDEEYESNTFTTDQLGVYEFSAAYEGIASNSITISSALSISSLSLTADRFTIPANDNTFAELIALDQDEDTVSNFVSYFNGSSELEGPAFHSGEIGSHSITAKYEGIESNELIISAEKQKNRKVLIEEFTGEWCGWCPQAAYNLDQLVQSDPNVLTVGIHNGDGLAYANEALIRNSFGINYFPSGIVGRVYLGQEVGFNDPVLSNDVLEEVDRQINKEEVLAGISIASSYTGGEAFVDVNVKFYQTIDEEVNITIYLIENEVVSGSQENYFSGYSGYETSPFYNLPGTIEDYEHNYVLRKAGTDALGDEIPSDQTAKDNTYSFGTKTISISGIDPANSYIIAFVSYDIHGDNKSILNAQQVKLGESIGYDE
ncbi:MAG: Omp28-related outer membrane protein [Cyclobacteriaceae bacterium]|nr:Omp28-related outer membrane protein [Cyclobacteriaceae bacterium]